MLWFDIEFINFTTSTVNNRYLSWLWFDIEFINFTTLIDLRNRVWGCGLI